jgi:hypothetical protein
VQAGIGVAVEMVGDVAGFVGIRAQVHEAGLSQCQ